MLCRPHTSGKRHFVNDTGEVMLLCKSASEGDITAEVRSTEVVRNDSRME